MIGWEGFVQEKLDEVGVVGREDTSIMGESDARSGTSTRNKASISFLERPMNSSTHIPGSLVTQMQMDDSSLKIIL